MNSASILVVDDELGIRSTIHDILTDEGYAVETAADAGEARTHYRSDSPDLVLLDIWMPDTDGISLLKEWADAGDLKCPVVVMSGHGTVETAVEATRLGAVDFIEKPLSLEQLLSVVETALTHKPLQTEPLAEPVAPARVVVEAPPGKSPVIRAVREQARQVAELSVPVLISGEPGSGRDLFGRYIHSLGPVPDAPFVQVSGATTQWRNWSVPMRVRPGCCNRLPAAHCLSASCRTSVRVRRACCSRWWSRVYSRRRGVPRPSR